MNRELNPCSHASPLRSRLLQLQSRFTWDLQQEDVDLDSLSTRLQEHIKLRLGHPGSVALSCSFLAYVRYLQARPEEAVSLLNQSEEKTREYFGEESERRLIVVYGDLAWLNYHTGDYTQSHAYCQTVENILVKHPTSSSSVLHPEVYGEIAWTYLKFSWAYYTKAIECFHKALELQPDDSEWNAGLAIALYRTESRYLETSLDIEESPAIKQLRRALEINPDDGVLLSMLAIKIATYQRHQEAKDLVEKALMIDPDNPHVIRYVAKYLRNQGNVDDSIDLLEQALKKTSESAFIHHQLALCYKRKKTAEQRSKPFNNQSRHKTNIHLSKSTSLSHDMYRANKLFQKALQMLPESDKGICQFFHLCYADFHYYHTKQETEAITHYTKGLLLPIVKWDQKQCAKRLKQIAEQRLSKDENDGGAHSLLGLVAKTQGEKKRAVEFYEKALDCDANNDEYLSALLNLRMELQ
ncbi:hypothetical protein PAMP_009856 [Pampus punctatissimus]